MGRILMPLPDHDFDPTEVAVPWKILREAGHDVVFATESGGPGAADPLMLGGALFGQLGAEPDALRCYGELTEDAAFRGAVPWSEVDASPCDGLFLAGGHAPGMRPYLESQAVQGMARAMWSKALPVAAICHGVIVLARATGPDGRSLLAGRTTTTLPKYLERTAYYLTAWKLGRYYRTYPTYVEDEVRDALGPDGTFVRGPRALVARGTRDDDRPAFVVADGHYLSARWPGDAYLIAKRFVEQLAARARTAA